MWTAIIICGLSGLVVGAVIGAMNFDSSIRGLFTGSLIGVIVGGLLGLGIGFGTKAFHDYRMRGVMEQHGQVLDGSSEMAPLSIDEQGNQTYLALAETIERRNYGRPAVVFAIQTGMSQQLTVVPADRVNVIRGREVVQPVVSFEWNNDPNLIPPDGADFTWVVLHMVERVNIFCAPTDCNLHLGE